MGDVVLLVDDLKRDCFPYNCRICHEEESESCKSFEAPCACSGTVKFAHRDCIQRWCNEKGNTTCEICLKDYTPDYTTISKKSQLLEAAVTISRNGLEIQIRDHEPRSRRVISVGEGVTVDTEFSECSSGGGRGALYCRILIFMLTFILLIKHLYAALTGETEDYPFTLTTILALRATGILLPMYLIIRAVSIIQQNIRHQHHRSNGMLNIDEEEEMLQQQQHLV